MHCASTRLQGRADFQWSRFLRRTGGHPRIKSKGKLRRKMLRGGSRVMDKGLSGQAAIVTGGARGIGLGIAQRLSAEGVRVAVWDRDLAALDESPGYRPAFAQTVDITDLNAVRHAFTLTETAFGDIHIFVNNAGVNGPVV